MSRGGHAGGLRKCRGRDSVSEDRAGSWVRAEVLGPAAWLSRQRRDLEPAT